MIFLTSDLASDQEVYFMEYRILVNSSILASRSILLLIFAFAFFAQLRTSRTLSSYTKCYFSLRAGIEINIFRYFSCFFIHLYFFASPPPHLCSLQHNNIIEFKNGSNKIGKKQSQ